MQMMWSSLCTKMSVQFSRGNSGFSLVNTKCWGSTCKVNPSLNSATGSECAARVNDASIVDKSRRWERSAELTWSCWSAKVANILQAFCTSLSCTRKTSASNVEMWRMLIFSFDKASAREYTRPGISVAAPTTFMTSAFHFWGLAFTPSMPNNSERIELVLQTKLNPSLSFIFEMIKYWNNWSPMQASHQNDWSKISFEFQIDKILAQNPPLSALNFKKMINIDGADWIVHTTSWWQHNRTVCWPLGHSRATTLSESIRRQLMTTWGNSNWELYTKDKAQTVSDAFIQASSSWNPKCPALLLLFCCCYMMMMMSPTTEASSYYHVRHPDPSPKSWNDELSDDCVEKWKLSNDMRRWQLTVQIRQMMIISTFRNFFFQRFAGILKIPRARASIWA